MTSDWYQEQRKHLPGRKTSLYTVTQSLNIPLAGLNAGPLRELGLLGHAFLTKMPLKFGAQPFTLYIRSLCFYYGQTREVDFREIRKVVLGPLKVSFQILPSYDWSLEHSMHFIHLYPIKHELL